MLSVLQATVHCHMSRSYLKLNATKSALKEAKLAVLMDPHSAEVSDVKITVHLAIVHLWYILAIPGQK